MTLKEYNAIIFRLEAFYDYARRRASYGEPELLEKAAVLERDLLEEYNAGGENLAFECIELAKNPAREHIADKLREGVAVSSKIKALAGDLASGAASCPEEIKGWLILALNGLYSLVSSLSRACARELDKIEPKEARSGQDFREVIEGNKKARGVCERLRAAGFLDTDYKFIYNGRKKGSPTREEEGAAASALCGYFAGEVAPIAQHWGINPRRLSKYMNDAKENPHRVAKITKAIKGE